MKKAVAVVAHYDDALLWAGGSIKRTLCMGWDWTVVAVCERVQERKDCFLSWCYSLRVKPVVLGFADYRERPPCPNDEERMRSEVLAAIRGTSFDWIFTHNPDLNGEYGSHLNHKEVAEVAASLVAGANAICGKLVSFAYQKDPTLPGSPVVPRASASHYVQLNYDELTWKAECCVLAALADPIPNLASLGWPCPNPEAFLRDDPGLPLPFVRR